MFDANRPQKQLSRIPSKKNPRQDNAFRIPDKKSNSICIRFLFPLLYAGFLPQHRLATNSNCSS